MTSEINQLKEQHETARINRMEYSAGLGRTMQDGVVIRDGGLITQEKLDKVEELRQLERVARAKLRKAIRSALLLES